MVDIRESVNNTTDLQYKDALQEESLLVKQFFLLLFPQRSLTSVAKGSNCPHGAVPRNTAMQQADMYEGGAGWVTAIPQSQSSQDVPRGHFSVEVLRPG